MEHLLRTSDLLTRLVTTAGKGAAWLMLALMLVIVIDVTLRGWFPVGSTRLQELQWHLHGTLFLLTIGWAYSRDAHVRIELFHGHFSARTKAWMELAGCLLFLLPYVGAILYFGYDYAMISFSYNETSASPSGLPARWVIKSIMLFGFALLGLAGLAKLLRAIVYLAGGPQLVASIDDFRHPPESPKS